MFGINTHFPLKWEKILYILGFSIGIIILVGSVFLRWYAILLINGLNENLSQPNLPLTEIWRLQGSLDWWNSIWRIVQPVSIILTITGVVLSILFPAVYFRKLVKSGATPEVIIEGVLSQSPILLNTAISLTLLSIGCAAVAYSIYYPSTITAFIGLTLVLWGSLLLYVLPQKFIKREVTESMISSSQQSVEQTISELNLEGKAIYVPFQKELFSRYNVGFQNEFIYIPKKNVDASETITQAFINDEGTGLRLNPTGLGLANLMQEKTKQKFQNMDLASIPDVLSTIMVRELGVAKDFRMAVFEDNAYITLTKPITLALYKEAKQLSQSLGCPLCSSVACVLSRVTGRPVAIEKCITTGNTVEAQFHYYPLSGLPEFLQFLKIKPINVEKYSIK